MLALWLASAGYGQEVKTVCATRPAEALPAGTAFGVAPAFLDKARALARGSSYETLDFPAVWDARVEWLGGRQVSVSCTLSATLHQLENGRFSILKTSVKTVTALYPRPGQPPRFLRVKWDLDDGEIQFPAALICEFASERRAGTLYYASEDMQHLPIGELQTVLFEALPLRVRTETAPEKCAALP